MIPWFGYWMSTHDGELPPANPRPPDWQDRIITVLLVLCTIAVALSIVGLIVGMVTG